MKNKSGTDLGQKYGGADPPAMAPYVVAAEAMADKAETVEKSENAYFSAIHFSANFPPAFAQSDSLKCSQTGASRPPSSYFHANHLP